MSETRLMYLMGQYFHGLATVPETDELMALIVLPEHEKTIERILDKGWSWINVAETPLVFEKGHGQAILERIISAKSVSVRPVSVRAVSAGPVPNRPVPSRAVSSQAVPEPERKLRYLPYWRWSAAAAILLILAGAVYYYASSPKAVPMARVIVAPGSDARPGSDKAILTLAGGQRILLDSAASGTIAQQGNTRIDKIAGEVLSYNERNAKPGTVFFNTLTTPRGGQYQLRLPDGSRVWLDAASSITYPTAFTGKERRVRITGQAYLEIAHDPRAPFIAEVNGREIKDIGTAFNINAYDDEAALRVTLVSGSVAVGMPGERVVLQPEQQLKITGEKWEVADHTDLEEALAWKNGKFLFGEKADIATIMRQLARWYDVDIHYQGQVKSHFVGSISRQVNISKVLEMLVLTGAVNFRVEGRTVTVTP